MSLRPKVYSLIISVVLLLPVMINAQITVNSTAGLPTNNYSTLKAAFDNINLGVHQGQITILVTGSTTETATAVLNASGGNANYSSVHISPTTTATISGSIAGPLISLNGADTVTIDGRIGGIGSTRSLTIQNTYNGAQAAAYVVLFTNAANKNILRYTSLEGLGQTNYNNATVRLNGLNTYVTIDFNDIRPFAGGLQNCPISAQGTSCNITNNLIHDFVSFGTSFSSAGLDMQGANNCVITGNSFYQSVSITQPTNFIQFFVRTFSGSNYTISKNYFGGSQPNAQGSPTIYNGFYVLVAIDCYQNTGGSIDSNVITNISMNSATMYQGFGGISVASSSYKIGLSAGNIIGSMTDTAAISVANGNITGIVASGSNSSSTVDIQNNLIGGFNAYGGATNPGLSGIVIYDMDTATIRNNVIGGTVSQSMRFVSTSGQVRGISIPSAKAKSKIRCSENIVRNISGHFSGSGAFQVSGIYNLSQFANDTSKRWLQNNVISNIQGSNNMGDVIVNGIYSASGTTSGSSFINSVFRGNHIHTLSATATGSSSSVSGITTETPVLSIDSNLITNISSSVDNLSSVTTVAVQGIGFFSPQNSQCNIKANTISNLSSTSVVATTVSGINALYNSNTKLLTISANRIDSLHNSSSTGGTVAGIIAAGSGNGQYLIKNNMISLAPANSNVYGIFNNLGASALNAYYNSVYLAGTATGSNVSAALNRVYYANTAVDLRNNIFINLRTGGSGNHYAVMNGNSNPDTNWNYSNYNDLYSSNAATTVLWGSAPLSFVAYQTASLKDSCSVNQLVDFIDPTSGDLHLQNTANNQLLIGKSVSSVTNDFDGDPRNLFPTMGADELLLPYQGSTIAGPTTICVGDSIILTSNSANTLQWYRNGLIVPGATSNSLTVYQPGVYTGYVVNGCLSDSTNSITVSAVIVDTSVVQNGTTLISPSVGLKQWVDCNNNYASIPGANSFVFMPPVSGSYAVIIYENSCLDTSACFNVVINGISDTITNTNISVFPNPFIGEVTLKGVVAGDWICVVDKWGRKLQQHQVTTVNQDKFRYQVNIPTGNYLLVVYDKQGNQKTSIHVSSQ
jgi:hypothetical protein